jgi:hypothetical protein
MLPEEHQQHSDAVLAVPSALLVRPRLRTAPARALEAMVALGTLRLSGRKRSRIQPRCALTRDSVALCGLCVCLREEWRWTDTVDLRPIIQCSCRAVHPVSMRQPCALLHRIWNARLASSILQTLPSMLHDHEAPGGGTEPVASHRHFGRPQKNNQDVGCDCQEHPCEVGSSRL